MIPEGLTAAFIALAFALGFGAGFGLRSYLSYWRRRDRVRRYNLDRSFSGFELKPPSESARRSKVTEPPT
jgi:hypothetical protein